jgi:hypothetical protein
VTPARRNAARWALHPLAPALALLVGCVAAVAVDAVAAAPLLAAAAGCAAGFANSGST